MKQLARYILILALVAGTSAHATEVQQKTTQVVAGILLEIPRYLSFSESHSGRICIIDNAPLASEMSTLNQRKQSYKEILQKNNASSLADCNFIYGANKSTMRKSLKNKALQHTISISNYASFVDEGGPIAVLDNNGVIGIELNISAAKKRGISFNPDLIDVSVRVIR